ncbi:hypothetical protein [Paenibacillus hunanensis]|nr:hypothetical protein [Paenibacillus hunanensis]
MNVMYAHHYIEIKTVPPLQHTIPYNRERLESQMECIVKFDVVHEQETKSLRGLIFVNEDELPNVNQLTEMLTDMKYEVKADPSDPMRYNPVNPQADYQYIHIRELDTGDKTYKEDRDLKNIVSNLLPSQNRPI